ncbi:MAG: ABC transporter substrate-binding protein [Nitrospinae bacterium CG11_big_fil_rev_8_21_14_0_20_45_15]|nr:MAG: ABC transporter substrate-binding protein [Nitrospinae bacterium CG11_big_fil_rev_8_21_14_0_20_45_15]
MNKLFTLLIALLFAVPSFAEPLPGLSLYGAEGLKYKANEPYAYADTQSVKGGRLVLADFGAFTKLNPLSLKGVASPGLNGLVFQTPMDSSADDDEPFSQYGTLVESVELADDRMSMIYHLYKNAKFSDDKPVTADDFVFSFNLIQDPEYHPIYKAYFHDIKSVEKIDAHTVKYHFSTFNQELPLITGQMTILPKHIYGAPGKKFGSDFDQIAVGSGPYIVEKYEFGKYITLKRNKNWWAKDLAKNQGRYNFDEITWKIFLDPVAEREAFKGGEYDVIQVNSSRDWALDYKGDFIKKGYYKREKFMHNRVAGMQGFAMNLRNDLFKSRKVRAAVALAFDFEWSNKNLFYGQYTRNENYFDNNSEMKPQGLPEGNVKTLLENLRNKYKNFVPKTALTKPVGAPGEGQPIEKNLALASALLESDGWKMGPDGIRQKDGKPFKFKLILVSPAFQRISEPFKNNLAKIGLDMDIQVVQVAQYEEIMRDFKFDMIVASYGQSRSPGNEQRSMWSSEAAVTPGSRNLMGIQNPAVDELIDLIVKASTRKELIDAIQALDRILTHQFYMVPHWYIAYDRAAYWNKFSHPKINPSQSPIISNIIEWWSYDEALAKRMESARAKDIPLQ